MKIFQVLGNTFGNDYSIEEDENSDVGEDEFLHSETLEYVDKDEIDETGAEGETGENNKTGSDDDFGADDKDEANDNTGADDKTGADDNTGADDKTGADDNTGADDKTGADDDTGADNRNGGNDELLEDETDFKNNVVVSQNFVDNNKDFDDANMNTYNANDALSSMNEQVFQNIKQSNGVKTGFENNFAVSQNLFDDMESFGDVNINADIANDPFSTFNQQVFQNNHPNENVIHQVKKSNGFNWIGPIQTI